MEVTWKPPVNSHARGVSEWERVPRSVRLALSSLGRGVFYEAVAADRHAFQLMKRNTTYVPLAGYLFEKGYHQSSSVRVINARQTGKTDALTQLYKLTIYRQAAWRAIAACPTAFCLEYLPAFCLQRNLWSGKSTDLSLVEYLRGWPAQKLEESNYLPLVSYGDMRAGLQRLKQRTPYSIPPGMVLTVPSNVGKSKPVTEIAQLLSSLAINRAMRESRGT